MSSHIKRTLLGRWGRLLIPLRWPILIAALLCATLGAIGTAGGLERLISGGFSDPGSDSARVAHRVSVEFKGDGPDLLTLCSSATETVDDPSFRERLAPALDALRGRAGAPKSRTTTTHTIRPSSPVIATPPTR